MAYTFKSGENLSGRTFGGVNEDRPDRAAPEGRMPGVNDPRTDRPDSRREVRPPPRLGTPMPSYGDSGFFGNLNKDRQIGYQAFLADITGKPLEPSEDMSKEDIETYYFRTQEAKRRADQDFMGTGLTQQQYADGQQYGFTNFSDGRVGVSSGDRGPAPTVGLPAATDYTDFNPNNAFLRNRMAQMRGQQGMLPPPQTPGLPPQPRPQMPQQLAGIMQLQDRSNISPAMRYAAENYNRLGGRQMMGDEFERGRSMIQGQSV